MKLPYSAVEFTKDGKVADPAQVNAALRMLDDVGATDVIIMAHGWNNDMAAAERLYTQLGDNVADLMTKDPTRKPAVIGVLWPSIRWADDDSIAGGGVSVGDDVSELATAIRESVEDPELAAELIDLADSLDTTAGRGKFLERARTLLAPAVADEDPQPRALIDGETDAVFDAVRVAVATVADDLALPGSGTGQAHGDGSSGGGAGESGVAAGESAPGVTPDLGAEGAPGVAPDLLGTDTTGAAALGLSWPSLGRQVLNTVTYYTMKARAGNVGANGVAPLADRINEAAPDRRIHLVGHSFGARVVSAAATNIKTPVESLTLLQGAFSHYGFTKDYRQSGKDGAFRGAIANGLIHGPIVITHTHNDKAVLLAYAIASRLARQIGAAIGDREDPYGGIGANGSVGTGANELEMGDQDGAYSFAPGTINNLRADRRIASHGDVSNPSVANVLAHAAGLR